HRDTPTWEETQMSSYSFAEEWPGRGARGSKGHRHGPHSGGRGQGRHGGKGGRGRQGFPMAEAAELAGWALAKGRARHHRPSPEALEELMALRRMRGGPFGGPGGFGR